MTVQQEIELKLALTDPTALPRLLAAMPPASRVITQVNQYFTDPDGRLAEERIMVRVREERTTAPPTAPPERVILTVKRRTVAAGGVFASEESEVELDPERWAAVQAGTLPLAVAGRPVLQPLGKELGVREFVSLGAMTNTRHRVPIAVFVLEVDQTVFPDGHVEVEVEVETDRPEAARALVESFAADAGVAVREQTQAKFARFLAHRS